MTTAEPLAPVPWNARHLLPRPRISEAAVNVHAWFQPPLQLKIWTGVPSVVTLLGMSRHLPSVLISAFVKCHCWFEAPLHGYVCSCVPSVVLALGTSTQPPAAPWISEPTRLKRWFALPVQP